MADKIDPLVLAQSPPLSVRATPLLLTFVSAFALAPAVGAQITPERRLGAGVYAGASLPLRQLGDSTTAGYHVGALIDLPMNNTFGVRLDVAFTKFSDKPFAFGEVGTNALFGTLGGRMNLGSGPQPKSSPTRVSPFVVAGAGVYNIRFDIVRTSSLPGEADRESRSDLQWGLNLAAGVTMAVLGFRTFGQAAYHNLFGTGGREPNRAMFLASLGLRF